MKKKRVIFIFMVLVCFASSFCVAFVNAQTSEKDKALLTCEQLFGKQINTEPILFEVNRFYVIRMDFEGNKLLELAVQPKYYFEESHPDWEETNDFTALSYTEYKNLSAQLDSIKPKGTIVNQAKIGIVTNMTAWFTDSYENATLTRGVVSDLRKGDDAPTEINWFKVNFEKQKFK